ncbi:hypothetical protein KQI52_12190 [bacterium]|nr:hypothetical protein [bacterium]
MDLLAIPVLISGILTGLLSIITWLFRRRERINRVFSFFTAAMAIDSFAYFSWFQFGTVELVHTWSRIIFVVGFLVPIGLILFFFAFTGYDKRMDEKVLGIKVRHFAWFYFSLFGASILISIFTDWLIAIPENPQNIWDHTSGPFTYVVFISFAYTSVYMLTLAYRAYRDSDNRPDKRFIQLVSLGTVVWILLGLSSSMITPASSILGMSITYFGSSVMAVFYFIAIVNYQSDKVHELNVGLERKVEERTRHLEETRAQLVQSEKMAALGHLVAGVAHEMNTPVGAVYSTHSTLTAATSKLRKTLEEDHAINVDESKNLAKVLKVLGSVSNVIRTSGERITGIVKRLKTFAQLDEADVQTVDFNATIENTLEMFSFHLKPGVTVRTEFAELPPITCYPAQINQLGFQLLANANMAIDGEGEIVLRTELRDGELRFSVQDSGRGIQPEHLPRLFDPGFTAWTLNVGTGLGLAICYQIAQEHKGRIDVQTEVGKGSTFTLIFPVY